MKSIKIHCVCTDDQTNWQLSMMGYMYISERNVWNTAQNFMSRYGKNMV